MKFSKKLLAVTCSVAVGLGVLGAPTARADETPPAAAPAAAEAPAAKPKAPQLKKASVKVTKVPKVVAPDEKFTVKGSVRPARKTTVSLQYWTGKKWSTIGEAKTTSKGAFTVKTKLSDEGKTKFRVITAATDKVKAAKSSKYRVNVIDDLAEVAMKAALSKVGKSYRYGSSGPNAFDCSGLTTYAYAKAGVKLPRSARAQMSEGEPVSKSELEPGDLVFFYRPVSHVAIYIGDGEVVHAGNRRTGVNVTKLKYMPFSGARRLADDA